jgi:hypothetical protein
MKTSHACAYDILNSLQVPERLTLAELLNVDADKAADDVIKYRKKMKERGRRASECQP